MGMMRRLVLLALPLLAAVACTVTIPTARSSPAAVSPQPLRNTPPPVTPVSPGQLTLGGLQAEFVQVIQKVLPSVVQISTDQGLGSGIIFDAAGDVVTNYHVVAGATSYQVTTYSGSKQNATLVGTYQAGDIAVLRITASGLRPAVFADSSKVPVGAIVMAIGNPLGLRSSVTEGIVSAFRSSIPEGNGVVLPQVVQTSAAINPGNSGGALVDLDGQVVGIPTLAATDPELGGSAPGIGFAIASNNVVDIANQLVQTGKVTNTHRAYLGVRIGDSSTGVYVAAVVSGGPAAKAGIVAGDIITAVAGQPTPDTATLAQVLAGLQPGQTVPVAITRSSGNVTVQVTLGTAPAG
jgi:S1-C subfamily serine protease